MIYFAYFVDSSDRINTDTFGWSKSRQVAQLFLSSFVYIDEDEYYKHLLEINCSDITAAFNQFAKEYNPLPFKEYDMGGHFEIKFIPSHDRQHSVLATDAIVNDMEYYVVEESEHAFSGTSSEDETYIHNLIFSMIERGLVRQSGFAAIIAELVMLMHNKYRINNVLRRLDTVIFMILEGYHKDFGKWE